MSVEDVPKILQVGVGLYRMFIYKNCYTIMCGEVYLFDQKFVNEIDKISRYAHVQAGV